MRVNKWQKYLLKMRCFIYFFLILQKKALSIIKIQMKMKHYFLISMFALSSAAALTSCSNNDVDFYDPAKIEADHSTSS